MRQSDSHFDTVKIFTTRAYPLPPVHGSIGRESTRRPGSQRRLGLGVNEQTGRLQWCPGFTCCKLLVVLPVVMLPVLLMLILLMRMDGMLMAQRLQQAEKQRDLQRELHSNQQQQHEKRLEELPTYTDDYYLNMGNDDAIDDMLLSEQLIVPYQPSPLSGLSEEERRRRCTPIKFGLSETIEVEERDLMKDARTSFLPQELAALPRECFQTFNYGNRFSTSEDYDREKTEDYFRKRSRRTSDYDYTNLQRDNTTSATALNDLGDLKNDATAETGIVANGDVPEISLDPRENDDNVNFIETMTALQSFWNEQGTKDSIRQTQANTMRKYMDTNVDPCKDFYAYACGNWGKLHPIPRDKAGFDTFEMLRENLDVVLKELLETNQVDRSGRPVKSKIKEIQDNSYDHNSKTNVDIVKSSSPTAPAGTVIRIGVAADSAGQSDEPKTEQEAARILRKHIVSRRHILGRLLNRYRRQTTNTKRKRLIDSLTAHASGFVGRNAPAVNPAPPVKNERSAKQKARDLYQSCINNRLLEKRGIQPLVHLIENLGGWPVLNPNWKAESFDWLNITAHLRRYNNDIFIVEWVGPDINNSDENIIQFDQTSLGLPTREYFLQDANHRYLQAYQRFMSEVMQKMGVSQDEAKKTASELISFETQLASITAPAEQRLNVTKLYKRMTLQQLHNLVPEINWVRYLSILQDRNVRDSEQVVIYATDYMQDLVGLITQTEPRTVANYLLWRFVRHRINNVDDRFEDSKQHFYHTLFGREESPSRWKVCIAQVNTNMGMALGSMFVTKYFDDNSKQDTLKMTHELQQAFRDILKTTDWIDAPTKHLAELKVNAMSLKIGYPDFILNPSELDEKYAGISIHPDQYFENTLNVLLHTSKMEQNKLHESVNKTAWQTAPAIVNAYYSRNKNQIMFPAGILQPPFYHRHFPRALNFGGIGVVIGHELTHGFDDKGRLFDSNGSIHKWWTDASIKGFDERARCIIAQYSNYTVGEVGIALNGESTQGENIADNGGIRQAFHAYKRWLQSNPAVAADERLPGINMSGEQLFFLNFGQVWCGAMRPEAVRNKLNTAIHSPGRFRVIGTVSNSPDFAREFKCPAGSPMNPVHKCSVW